jgi:hypothetical protein
MGQKYPSAALLARDRRRRSAVAVEPRHLLQDSLALLGDGISGRERLGYRIAVLPRLQYLAGERAALAGLRLPIPRGAVAALAHIGALGPLHVALGSAGLVLGIVEIAVVPVALDCGQCVGQRRAVARLGLRRVDIDRRHRKDGDDQRYESR